MILEKHKYLILKNKDSILAAFEANVSTHKKCRVSKFSDINEAMYDWYTMAVSKKMYPDGLQLLFVRASLILKVVVAGSLKKVQHYDGCFWSHYHFLEGKVSRNLETGPQLNLCSSAYENTLEIETPINASTAGRRDPMLKL